MSPSRPRLFPAESLARRFAVWTGVSALLSLVSFAVTVFALLVLEAREPHAIDPPLELVEEEYGEEVLVAMLIAGPPSLLVAIGGSVWASHRVTGPLRAVARAVSQITPADLARRIDVEVDDADLRNLVLAFNGLLDRLERGLLALDRYAADVSHELRTPLAVTIANLEVSLRNPRSIEHWESQAARALEELSSLATLADSMLVLARGATGAGMPSTRVALLEEVAPVIERASEIAARQHVELVVTLPPSGRTRSVLGSAALLRSAISNLLDNAIKYASHPGRVAITFEDTVIGVRVTVEDSGPGVPDAEREQVFQPMFRAPPQRARPPGIGLGLTVTKRTVEAHGGTIRVGRSACLGGAAFTVELPSDEPRAQG
ncbi:MAG: HAMP domain-containing histidine kinase [Myxococcales bacterium]|nr:HAMP domain-containing histidine kinase [Myxococcales bacterium]